jgi:predicted PurR-regulated permease PerM
MNNPRPWFWVAGIALVGWIVYLLAPVLAPFLTAAVLAYIGNPLVYRLERYRFSRTQAVIVVFLVVSVAITIALLLFIPLLQDQVRTLVTHLPMYVDWAQNRVLPWLQNSFGISAEAFDVAVIKDYLTAHWQGAGNAATWAVAVLSRSGLTLMGWIGNLILIPVVTFYLLRDWNVLIGHIRELVPRRLESDAVRLTRASDEVLGAFFRGQLLVMFALGLIYSTGLSVVGIELGFLLGMIAGLLSFVPYLGFIVGVVAASIAALIQFQDWMPVMYVLLVFGIGQVVESFVLTPLLLGDRIGLHPVAVIFAVLAGGQLFGFVGVLLALPAAAVIMVLLRYTHERYLQSPLYGPSTAGE